MKSPREEFAPPASVQHSTHKFEQVFKDLQGVRQIGADLKNAGVTQDTKQANLTLVKNDKPADHSAHKDLGVKQGDRPALSPCDGQVQQAGQGLKNNGATGAKTQSAAQQFGAPAQTPKVQAPAVSGRSR